ncbi:MAG: DedA family protein [Thermodesulfobacteriota bacterium]
MDLLLFWVDFLLHIDRHLGEIIRNYGAISYVILFLIVFCETGLVVTPFLPGDSLLFAAGSFAAIGAFDVVWLLVIISAAAILGDTVNYWIGRAAGPRVFYSENVRFLNRKHLERTHEFYERHGGKTIILARFIPIIRTFAPFVAGMGRMTYWHFIAYNLIGGIIWPVIFILAGYFFGNLPVVKDNFSLVLVIIILLSVMPLVVEFFRFRIEKKRNGLK